MWIDGPDALGRVESQYLKAVLPCESITTDVDYIICIASILHVSNHTSSASIIQSSSFAGGGPHG